MKAEVYEQIALFARQMEDSAELLTKIALAIPDEVEALKVAETHILELRSDVMYQTLWFLHEEETGVSGELYEERRKLQKKFFDPAGTAGAGIDHLLPSRLPGQGKFRHNQKSETVSVDQKDDNDPGDGTIQ